MKYSGTDIGLLLVRVAVSTVFMAHGFDNIVTHLYFLGIIELVSGLGVLFGVFTNWFALFMAADMIGSVTISKVYNGFGGWDLELVLFLSAIAIAFAGAGKYVVKFRSKA